MLTAVQIPAARPGTRSTYRKLMDREAWTHAVVSAAVVLEMDQDVVRSARVVLGGVAPIPWRLPEVEKVLAGQRITDAVLQKAGEVAVAGARPLSQNAYKVPLTRNLVRRTIEELAGGPSEPMNRRDSAPAQDDLGPAGGRAGVRTALHALCRRPSPHGTDGEAGGPLAR